MKYRMPRIVRLLPLLLLLLVPSPALGQGDGPPPRIQTIPLPDLPAYLFELSPDGNRAALFVAREALVLQNVSLLEYEVEPALLPIRLIDVRTGEETLRLAGGTDYVSDVAFTPAGEALATYHRNGEIILWDVESGEAIGKVDAVPNGERIKFLPDGRTVILHSSGIIGMFLELDVETGVITRIVREQFDSIGSLGLSDAFARLDYQYAAWALSPDGGSLATASGNGEVKLWDMDSREKTIILPRAEQMGRFPVRSFQFSADGSTLAYFSETDDHTHFWNIAAQAESAALPVGGRFFALSSDMSRLAWTTRVGAWVTDVNQVADASMVVTFPDDLLSVATLAFSPDGSRLVVGGFSVRSESGDGENVMYVIELE